MKIYIAGPMTGIQDWNYPAFFQAEATLRLRGHDPINPARTDGETLADALTHAGSPDAPKHPWSYYLRRDINHVAEADAICLLPGWQKSKGARLEVTLATALGLPLYILRDGKLQPRITAIGLSGYARSGKDTVGDHLANEHGYTKVSFADPMREALKRLNPTIDVDGYNVQLASALEYFTWDELKAHSDNIRPLLQRFGTEVGRDMFGQDFWVNYAISRLEDGARVVFTDVRFPNEAEAVKALGGKVWRIERPGVEAANGHASEHALDSYRFDVTLSNDSTYTHLYEAATKALA